MGGGAHRRTEHMTLVAIPMSTDGSPSVSPSLTHPYVQVATATAELPFGHA